MQLCKVKSIITRSKGIRISSQTTLGEIRRAFNNKFPYLKLIFFKQLNPQRVDFSKKSLIANDLLTVGKISKLGKEGVIKFSAQQKAGRLEQLFSAEFGLYVQVFRRSATNWLETITTDDVTLAKLNEMARKSILDNKKTNIPDMDFYHEQS